MNTTDLTPEERLELLAAVLAPMVFGPKLRFIPERIVAPRPVVAGLIWRRPRRCSAAAAAAPRRTRLVQ